MRDAHIIPLSEQTIEILQEIKIYKNILIHNDTVMNNIEVPESIFIIILRRAKFLSGVSCVEARMLSRDLPILLQNDGRSIKKILDDTNKRMNIELRKLSLVLSKRIIITKNTFFSWIRSGDPSNGNDTVLSGE